MLRDLVSATYKGEYLIELAFEDGERGTVDFSSYADRGGVFERFKDIEYFRRFSVNAELGTLTWDGELDIAPESLYARATRQALPEWMRPATHEK